MLLLSILLLPMVLAAPSELRINAYGIRIENNTLMSVQATQRSSNELNLSGLGLQRIDRRAFNNVDRIKILNLDDNSIAHLPMSVFSNLKNLEHLSLVKNNIKDLNRAFVGLDNLKYLDISNNPVESFEHGQLYGLSNTVNIITRGNSFKRICSALYDNIPPRDSSEDNEDLEHIYSDDNDDDYEGPGETNEDEAPRPGWASDFPEEPAFRVKVCIHQEKVKLVDYMQNGEILPAGCSEVKHDDCCNLYIDNFGIKGFERGWYRIKNTRDRSIDGLTLKGNNIVRVTKELLNDLPASIRTVDLSRNKIERIERGIIRNSNIHFLYMSNNMIRTIDDDAFENTYLWQLNVNGNRLKNIKFITTLPGTMVKLFVNRNDITELPNLPVLNFYQLTDLHISENKITVVRKNALRGLPSLLKFDLSNNRIRTLEPGCFRGMKSVRYLHLRGNDIAVLDDGIFNVLQSLKDLDLGRNKLTRMTEGFRNSLPHNLDFLQLDYNAIDKLESGSFVNVPKRFLNLEGNRISSIARGSFVVPHLYGDDLEHEEPDASGLLGPLFAGNYLAMLFASYNNITLPSKQKGIGMVNLSRNPIQRLENGALYGIRKGSENRIYLSQTPIELVQGGLFDDL